MPNRSLHEGLVFGNYRLVRLLGRGGLLKSTSHAMSTFDAWPPSNCSSHRSMNTTSNASNVRHRLLRPASPTHHLPARLRRALAARGLINGAPTPSAGGFINGTPAPDEHIPYLVMEYASSGTLRQRHPRGTILSPTEALTYMSRGSEGTRLRAQPIHHSPRRETREYAAQCTGHPAVERFGIATLTSEFGAQVTPSVAGTATYMAPEQLRGKTRPESDQYALAVVVYEWLCGETPFHGTYPQIAVQHINTPPPSLRARNPAISPAVEEVVNIALSKEPGQRYPSVTEFVKDFRLALQPARLHGRRERSPYDGASVPQRSPLVSVD